jgi:predicted deacylase
MKSRNTRKAGHRPVCIGGITVRPGKRMMIDLPVPPLYTHTSLAMPVHVVHGKTDGPRLFVSAAVHGDEINGIEIIRRLLQMKLISKIRGVLIAVPVVNVYGFINQSRYLPDRRDLNRSFPGTGAGTLAGRLARIFADEIAGNCTHGIDLHTAAIHRDNLPHVRACLDDPEAVQMAQAFSVPVILDTALKEGSMRSALDKRNIPVIVYEGGEALRFNERAINAGVKGILSVMRMLGMLPKQKPPSIAASLTAKSGVWIRAAQSGIFRSTISLGAAVRKNRQLGVISDHSGVEKEVVYASASGIVIGRINNPLVYEGEALFHIARSRETASFADILKNFEQEVSVSPAGSC